MSHLLNDLYSFETLRHRSCTLAPLQLKTEEEKKKKKIDGKKRDEEKTKKRRKKKRKREEIIERKKGTREKCVYIKT